VFISWKNLPYFLFYKGLQVGYLLPFFIFLVVFPIIQEEYYTLPFLYREVFMPLYGVRVSYVLFSYLGILGFLLIIHIFLGVRYLYWNFFYNLGVKDVDNFKLVGFLIALSVCTFLLFLNII